MSILVTGAAGFIGFSTAIELLNRGEQVVGLDNLNDYYSVILKEARLARLKKYDSFSFVNSNISNFDSMAEVFRRHGPFCRVVHLAAQAGVRYSTDHPLLVIKDNIEGHANILELCRRTENFEHFVYASSSSVYGLGENNLPSSTKDRIDQPISIYAATKAADELISYSYGHLHGLPQTGLRYFTVYGPWGRPDMSVYLFTDAILNLRPIRVFNYGKMQRDFSYIDDMVDGTIRALDRPPVPQNGKPPVRAYNLGAGSVEPLMKLITLIEEALGIEAIKQMEPVQPGDAFGTNADIEPAVNELGFSPTVTLDIGIPRFVEWYREYHRI